MLSIASPPSIQALNKWLIKHISQPYFTAKELSLRKIKVTCSRSQSLLCARTGLKNLGDLRTMLTLFPQSNMAPAVSLPPWMAIHSRILALRIPWTEELGGLQSMGSWRVGPEWLTLFPPPHLSTFIVYFSCFIFYLCLRLLSLLFPSSSPTLACSSPGLLASLPYFSIYTSLLAWSQFCLESPCSFLGQLPKTFPKPTDVTKPASLFGGTVDCRMPALLLPRDVGVRNKRALGATRLQSMGSLRVGHDWATSLSLFTFMHWRRKWQPTTVFLPGESQGRRGLVGCRLWGRTESDTTEAT